MKDNDGWETITPSTKSNDDGWETITPSTKSNDDGWETISVTETPEYKSSYDQLKEDALRVGYSGLSDSQKQMIKSAYPQSLAGKAGRPFEEMTRQMDEQAGQYISEKEAAERDANAGNAYTAAKAFLSVPASFITAGWDKLTHTEHESSPEGKAIPVQDKPYMDYVKESQQAAHENRGLTGFASDPMNVISFGPGGRAISKGITKGAERLKPALGEGKLQDIPAILGNAAEGAAYGAGDAFMNDRDIGHSALLGAGFGGVLGGASDMAKAYSKHSFPGLNSQENRNLDPAAAQMVKDNFDKIMSPGILPKTKEGFYNLADKEKEELSKYYDAALENVNYDMEVESMKKNLGPGGPFAQLGAKGVTPDDVILFYGYRKYDDPAGWAKNVEEFPEIPLVTTLEILKEQLAKEYKTKLARRNALSSSAERLLDKDIEAVGKSRDFLGKGISISPEEASLLRTSKTNPETYKDPVAEMALARKDLGTSWRDVVNEHLESDPRYAKHVTAQVKKDYKLWKSLENVLDNPGRMGLGDRVPLLNFSLSPYLKSSTSYKLGEALGAGVRLRPSLFYKSPIDTGN